jgi:signal peptidase I
MRNRSPIFSLFSNALLILSIAALWYVFAPTNLGGGASYVMIDGNSMEPTFHTGDLVILAKASVYNVGDIVAYKDLKLDAHIIHRIIGIQDERFIMKGDNNGWIDSTHPLQSEVLGKKYLYLPKLGKWVKWIRVPVNMSLVVGVFGGGIIMSMTIQTKETQKKRKNQKSKSNGSFFEIPLYFAGILTILFLVTTLFSFSKPVLKGADKIPYSESGVFSYTASGTPNTYDSGSAISGEPIFLKLTCNLNLEYQFTFFSGHSEDISGFYHLIAIVRDQRSGWQRTLQLTPDSSFNGIAFSNQASLDICRIVSMVKSVEAETGVQSGSYNLEIISNVTVRGKVSGQQFMDTFEHPLAFQFDNSRLYMGNLDPKNDPFHKTTQKLIPSPLMVDNTISILKFKPSIKAIRLISLIGLFASAIGLLLVGMYYNKLAKIDRCVYIKLKYGPLIVDVSISGSDNVKLIIDIKSIEELVTIANHQNSLILHMERDKKHFYLIENEGTVYRYSFTIA